MVHFVAIGRFKGYPSPRESWDLIIQTNCAFREHLIKLGDFKTNMVYFESIQMIDIQGSPLPEIFRFYKQNCAFLEHLSDLQEITEF